LSCQLNSQLGNSIKSDAAGIGIPASDISLFRHGSGIGIIFHSGTGLTGC
jgi:hypothetical protein